MSATRAPLLKLADVALVAAGRTLVEHLDLEIRPWRALGGAGSERRRQVDAAAGDVGRAVAGRGRPCFVDDLPIDRYGEFDLARVRALVTDRWIDPFASSVLDTVLTARYVFGDEDGAGEQVARRC